MPSSSRVAVEEKPSDETFDRLADLFGKFDGEGEASVQTTLEPIENSFVSVAESVEEAPTELRYDTDGVAYTKQDFIDYYGGTREWQMAEVANVDNKVKASFTSSTVDPVQSEMTPEKEEGTLSAFRLSESTINMLNDRGVEKLFPIQQMTFDTIYDGKDLIARARTGTGKTLAFSLPVMEKLRDSMQQRAHTRGRLPKVLVLAPTRELAKQVATDFESIGGNIKTSTLYGGAPFGPQAGELRRGTDIVVGTAGRVMDHMESGSLNLADIEYIIMDEADRMLDIGFADDIERILQEISRQSSGQKVQTLLFSATVPKWIKGVAKKYMQPNYEFVDLIGDDSRQTAEGITHLALKVDRSQMASTLGDIVQVYAGRHGRTIIFTQTKAEANDLVLGNTIKQECLALHGDIPQEQRERTLAAFRDGNFRCLIATDVAARGLDIPAVDVVIQVQPPKHHDDFIHRSGRTARAGKTGTNIIFYNPRDERVIRQLEQKAGVTFKRIGAPQPKDIIEACAEDAVHSLSLVTDEAKEHFKDSAVKLIEEHGAEDALAAALAHISGHTEIKQRSLMSSAQGFTTWGIKLDRPAAGKAVIRRLLASGLDPDIVGAMRGLTMFADNTGAAFDLPCEFNKDIEEDWSGVRGTIEKLTHLPELKKENSYGDRGQGRDRGGGRDRGRRSSNGYGGGGRDYNNNYNSNRFGGGGGREYGGGRRGGDRNERFVSGPVFPGGPDNGATLTGRVTGVMPFGAFVDYGYGKDGLVATRNIGDFWIDDPKDVLQAGMQVTVKVTGAENGKVRLSMKGLNPHITMR
eukprot:CAMPEP_0184482684 /NCGR_PEP_ID=MMETSP0113_2-20130426/4249_1 /TAXON_ID=91329 /ORGANISM="Norrisiella sphaerica, Strain BC52" /LENGTH=804 /DNA_ID=CAMNT_0026862559 /DNA_START=320 /DNA_END=2734 /DNA_ORIENTATION=+